MNTNTIHHNAALLQPHRMRMSPLAVAAAVAIILFCGVGIASMTGLLPSAFSKKTDDAALTQPVAENSSNAASAPATGFGPPTPLASSVPLAPPAAGAPAPLAPPAAVASAPLPPVAAATICSTCGTVEAVHTIEVKGQGTGLGAVGGGVVGGLLGHEIGNGRGNTALTLLGAAGGAFAGNAIEKNVRKTYSYRVTVRMDDGSYRTLSQSHPPSVRAGDKVRVSNGAVVARS